MKILDDIDNVTVTAAICVGVLISLLIFHLKRLQMYKHAAKFDGPSCVPFVGNALLFFGSTTAILKKMVEIINMHTSSMLRLWLGPELIIVTQDPEGIKQVLTDAKVIDKSKPFDFVKPCLGNGLVTATGEVWRLHRRLLGPLFNTKIIESNVDKFAAHSKILVENMEKEVDGSEFQIDDYVAKWAMDIICESAFGSSLIELGDPERRLVKSIHSLAEIGYKRLFKPWLYWGAIFNRSSLGKEFEEHRKFAHGIITKAIEKRKGVLLEKMRLNAEETPEKDTSSQEFGRESIMDYLIDVSFKNDKYSQTDIRNELLTMIVAGNESTGFTVSNALFLMANFPSVQGEKFCQRGVFGPWLLLNSIEMPSTGKIHWNSTQTDFFPMKWQNVILIVGYRSVSGRGIA
ncbi:cytochrome P450 4C1-like isoform X2 [Athalia rosae]|uniref:cytochrome P450 4C1-like isoform X2 n=1 Tax=Athalia rosae TaxID=37344 RepID=UPI0020340CD5|nr:cytochrome P450 4C1-like isoform X2 [Athalia rosae]